MLGGARGSRRGRVLLLSAALWLSATAVLGTVASEKGVQFDPRADQQRHLDVKSILDPVGVVSHIGETLGQAGRVLGLRIADSVADLVSSAFGHAPQPTWNGAPSSRPSWTRGDQGTLPASMQGVAAGPYYTPPGLRHPQPQPLQPAQPPAHPSVLGGIFRLLGLDSSKLGAIALNGVIFLAQLISSSLTGRPGAAPHARRGGDAKGAPDEAPPPGGTQDTDREDDEDDLEPAGTPLSWILENPALKGSAALRQAQDPDLSEHLIEEIQRRFPGRPGPGGGRSARSARSQEGSAGSAPPPRGPGDVGGGRGDAGGGGTGGGPSDTSCIQLLVCKAGPFLRGMQRSLRPVLRPPQPPASRGDTGDPRNRGGAGAGTQTAEEVDEAERWRTMTPVQRMFAHMPTTAEVLDQAHTCAERFPNCKVSY